MKRLFYKLLILLKLRKYKQPKNWKDEILRLYPEGDPPLNKLLKELPKNYDQKFNW